MLIPKRSTAESRLKTILFQVKDAGLIKELRSREWNLYMILVIMISILQNKPPEKGDTEIVLRKFWESAHYRSDLGSLM